MLSPDKGTQFNKGAADVTGAFLGGGGAAGDGGRGAGPAANRARDPPIDTAIQTAIVRADIRLQTFIELPRNMDREAL